MSDNFPIRVKRYTVDEVRAITNSALENATPECADSRKPTYAYKAVAELCNIAASDSALASLANKIVVYLKKTIEGEVEFRVNKLASRALNLELVQRDAVVLTPNKGNDGSDPFIEALFTREAQNSSSYESRLNSESYLIEPLYKVYKDVEAFISVISTFINAIEGEKTSPELTNLEEVKGNLDNYSKNLQSLKDILCEVVETISIKNASNKDIIRLFIKLALKLIELSSPEAKEKVLTYFEENKKTKEFLEDAEKLLLLILPWLSAYFGFYKAQYVVPYKIFCACCYAGKGADLKSISTKNIALGLTSIAYEAGNLYLAHNKGGTGRLTEVLVYRTAQIAEGIFARQLVDAAISKTGFSNYTNFFARGAIDIIGAGFLREIVDTLENMNQRIIFLARQVYSPYQRPD